MLPLVEFPELVERYAPYFQDVFSAEAYIEFKRYISGLIVSENKTVEGINRLMMVESRNQSSLNRLLTRSPFALEVLNRSRLVLLNSQPGTRMKAKGVLSVDDTLLTHYGQKIEHIAKLYDHVSGSYVWAHNLVTLHYSDDETDYPLQFGLWKPVDVVKLERGLRAAGVPIRESKEPLRESDPDKWRSYLLGVWKRRRARYPQIESLYASKLDMAQEMLQQWVATHPGMKWPVTFDSWYTQPAFCRFIDRTLSLPYVGTLTEKDKINLQAGQITLGQFADRLKQEHLRAVKHGGDAAFQPVTITYKGEQEQYDSYCRTHRIHTYGKKRLVINHHQADLADTPILLMSNRLRWQARGITRIRRHRWPVEVYHQEGKAEGLDQYQLRNFSAIERHIALVAVVYSMLRTLADGLAIEVRDNEAIVIIDNAPTRLDDFAAAHWAKFLPSLTASSANSGTRYPAQNSGGKAPASDPVHDFIQQRDERRKAASNPLRTNGHRYRTKKVINLFMGQGLISMDICVLWEAAGFW